MVTKSNPKKHQEHKTQDSEQDYEEPKPVEKGFQDEADQYCHGTEFHRMVVRRR